MGIELWRAGGNVPLRNLGVVQTKFQTATPRGSFDYAVGVSPISLAQPPPYMVCRWLLVLRSTFFTANDCSKGNITQEHYTPNANRTM